jgi:HD-like signal output (HDOD) protein
MTQEPVRQHSSQTFVRQLREAAQAGRLPLPSLPEVVLRIREAVNDDRKGVVHIAKLVQMDAALTARILKIANSALYHNGHTVDECTQAIVRLGLNTTRNLVSCLVMHNVFAIEHPLLQKRVRALWRHSCRIAAIASVLARVTTGLRPDKALLAGLVHDVGQLSILDFAQGEPVLLAQPAMLDEVIDELRGELGVAVLRAWGFSDDVCAGAQSAEDWMRDSPGPVDYADVIIVSHAYAYLGNAQMKHLPSLQGMPVFAKFPISRLGPDAGVELLHQAEAEISGTMRMLSGAGKAR